MSVKPEREEILSSYSMEELLELVQEKSELITQQKVNEIVEQFTAFVEQGRKDIRNTFNKPDSYQKQARDTRETTPKRQYTKRSKTKKTLGQLILEVVGSEPMNVKQIYAAVQKNGYQSKSQDPKRNVYLELTKQVKNENLIKTGRGLYVMA